MLGPLLVVLAFARLVVGLTYLDRVPVTVGSLYWFMDGPNVNKTRDFCDSPLLGPLNTTIDALWPTGRWGLSARFPPQTDKAAVSAKFVNWGASKEITIELWTKVAYYGSQGLLVSLTNKTVQTDVYNPDCPVAVEIALGYLQVWYPGTTGECVLGGRRALGMASAGSQNHIAVVANSSGFFLYLNGTFFSKSLVPAALPTIIDKSYWLEVFPFHPGYAHQMGSEIYMLAIHKEAVTEEVLLWNYQAGRPRNAVKANDQVVNVNEDELNPFSIAFTDGDPVDPWVFTITQLPARGTLYYWDFGNSTWAPVPHANWSSTNNVWTFFGALNDYSKPTPTTAYATFWFSISDGTNTTGAKRADIRVAPVNDLPIANNASYNGTAGAPILMKFSGSDIDIGDGVESVWITTLPENGTLYQSMGSSGGPIPNRTNPCNISVLPCRVTDAQFRMFYISNPMSEAGNGKLIVWEDRFAFIVRDKAPNQAASLFPGHVNLTMENPLKVKPRTAYIFEDAVKVPDTLVTFVGGFNLGSGAPPMFKLLSLPPKGRIFQLDGTPIDAVPVFITYVLSSNATIIFVPDPDDNGEGYAHLDYQLIEGIFSSPVATLVVSVTPVNDPPTLHLPFEHTTIRRGDTVNLCVNISDVDSDSPALVSIVNDKAWACQLLLPIGADVSYTCWNWADRGGVCQGNDNVASNTLTFWANRSVLNNVLSHMTLNCGFDKLTVNISIKVDDAGEVNWGAEGYMTFEVLKGDPYLRARDLLPTWQRALVWFAVAFVPSCCCFTWCYCKWRKKEKIRRLNEPDRIRIEMTADGQQVSTLTDPRTLERHNTTFSRLPTNTSSISSFRSMGTRSHQSSFMTGSFTEPPTTDEGTQGPHLRHQYELLCKTCGCSATKSDSHKAECKGEIPTFCRHCGAKWTGTYFCQQCFQLD